MLAGLVVMAFTGNILSTTPAHAATGDGSPTDPNISYIGRWDTSSSNVAISYWSGAYFKTDFTGTTVAIKLATAANIWVTIDGGGDVRYGGAVGTINLTPTPLAAGTHSLRVAAERETDLINFQGLILDPGATTVAPPMSSQLLEFVGDSITAGGGPNMTEGALSDYAWLIGERMAMEHTQVAQGSVCLVDNVNCGSPNSLGMSRQFFKTQTVAYPNSPDWDFSRYQANAVVINLGTNDGRNSAISAATFQSTYITFLQNVRAKYPNAIILVMRAFGGYFANETQVAVQAVTAAGDTNVQYIDTTNWLSSSDLTDGIHPSVTGHKKVANLLEPIIAAALGVPASNYYKLINRNSGEALDISGASTIDGGSAIQLPYNGSYDQQWEEVSVNGGYKLINRNSGMLLDDPGYTRTTGTRIDQWEDTYGNNQWWNLVSTGDGYYYLVNRSTGLYADVSGASTANSASVILWTFDGGANQQWQVAVA